METLANHLEEDEEEILEPEVPYLSVISVLLYLAQCTRPDISFAVNLLARYSNAQHVDTRLVLKTSSVTLRVIWIWACSIPMDPRVMPQPLLVFVSIPGLLVMSIQVTYLTHTRHALKRVTSLPLEAPQYLGGQLNRP